MKTHELKIDPQYFEAIADGRKTFEIRKNDRNYKVGDRLVLREYDSSIFKCAHTCDCHRYTGKEIKCAVSYITDFELKEGFVCMGIKII